MSKLFVSKFILTLVISLLSFFVLPQAVFASTLYLSPGKGTISIGGVTSVQIRLSAGGDAVNGVSAFLSYPADKLDVAWVSPGRAFAIEAEKSFGGGIIKVSRGNISPVSGDVNVATIGFRGKSAGSAKVSFIGGSAAPRASDSSESLNLGGSSGGTFSISAGIPQPTKTAAPAPSSGSKVAELLISDIKVTDVLTNSAVITWQTNGKADSLVEYGLEEDRYFLDASDETQTLNHSIKLENNLLTPGLKLHFRIKSKDAEDHEVSSENQTLQLTGYQVTVKVVDEAGSPQAGVEVWLYSEPLKTITDENGEAVFKNVSPGKHIAVVKTGKAEKTTEIQVVADTAAATPQSATASVSGMTVESPNGVIIQVDTAVKQPGFQNLPQLLIAGITISLAAFGATIIILVRKRKKTAGPSPIINVPGPPTNR